MSYDFVKSISTIAPCGMLIMNERGCIEYVNDALLALFQYNSDELIGTSAELLFLPALNQSDNGFSEMAQDSKISKVPSFFSSVSSSSFDNLVHCITQTETIFTAKIALVEIPILSDIKFAMTFLDVSKFSLVCAELERSSAEFDEFVNVASHDLKAPLRGISQLSHWVGEDIQHLKLEETNRTILLMQSRVHRLEKLLDDLLIYSKIGRYLGVVREVYTEQMINSVFELMKPSKSVKLTLKGAFPVFNTLHSPLAKVFHELLCNAMKHHDKEDIHIVVSCVEKKTTFEFSVQDNGPGIDSQFHKKIFKVFQTLKPRDILEGSGIGLSIVKKILELQNCSICLQSHIGAGCRFTFSWPKIALNLA